MVNVQIPKVTFSNEQKIPIFGLGTWKSEPGKVTQAVKDAIDLGYRHLDCAHAYSNEKEVGEAIKSKFNEGVIKREDLFITRRRRNFPVDKNGKMMFSDVDYIDTWKAMEFLMEKGYNKSIGLSNFNKRQIERVLDNATILPVNLQVETNKLGSPDRPWAKPEDLSLLDDPKLKKLAINYKKTPAQILLRYQVRRNHSVTKSRIAENIKIFDFELSAEDMSYIDTFDCNGRICPETAAFGHPYHPFENDEY